MTHHLPTALRRPPIRTADVHRAVHGRGTFGQFNTKLALWVTERVGTMWTAYLFAAIALVSLPAAIMSGSVIVIVAWVAQTFFQLVLLPVILVGQNVQAAFADKRARDDHEILTALHAINVTQTQILNRLDGKPDA